MGCDVVEHLLISRLHHIRRQSLLSVGFGDVLQSAAIRTVLAFLRYPETTRVAQSLSCCIRGILDDHALVLLSSLLLLYEIFNSASHVVFDSSHPRQHRFAGLWVAAIVATVSVSVVPQGVPASRAAANGLQSLVHYSNRVTANIRCVVLRGLRSHSLFRICFLILLTP